MSNCLAFVQASKYFLQQNRKVVIVQDCSFSFKQGESYAIMGPSGAGKSTCMHMLAGLENVSSGMITYNDVSIQEEIKHKHVAWYTSRIGLVFQEAYLLQELSIIENVMLKVIIANQVDKKAYHRACMLLERVGMLDMQDALPAELSGGQQQRIAVLRALFIVPSFLLLDEPTGNLDDDTGALLIQLLLEYQKEYDMGIIMSTHDQTIAQQMTSQVQLCNYHLLQQEQ